ncbi:ABC transporter ATP-binding protein [Haloferax mediterranei ATCC 33500]|uniref:Nickel import system ATP-binding protein NikD n=1 Tax=Haloferax mediterranei (strain ATCC 33500 / DSM 1411 / JCM 8866 / NBRC 14739 / NCIMB 2177 / R-4) TaxID=523841 RepID=I3R3I3_HALMT|nr:ABC transporter ATP-binding protein [Haloferax mediterranei]AFK18793.1 dipeptide/oligopeptide/nickel ABC transporter ATP-binding protein [Haloferax mediterranei ATCC 33500]AHZ21839.1 peptide ABC transporter ATP-binding protein [Haloferax mediterranei ATCC 33500]EMA03348.1 dipeptide/oligopeptide/nickel ABC transporter ATP-binding protein [Haloferax mediterranei ATCC 33500]MDX5988888.1 ABC transporter ATP-binding protein [Haloferax mediterranei ATCC 33500]QCQ75285.1 ABC transporter ATP-bindin
MIDPLLSVRDLHVQFRTDEGVVRAVDGISFDVAPGETVCVVGESGSGKTVACESITKLIPMPPGEIAGGEVVFDGEDLTDATEKQLQSIRGDRIAHIFQDPQGALNPVYPVGAQIVEAVRLHSDVSKEAARDRAIDLLDRVGIPEATNRVDDYPHEFSGGMKQRVVIAMALAADPDLLIADEPTTALDVTIQSQILSLLRDLQAEFGMSIIFVTHNLGVVAEIADRVVVMYAGKVMETGSVHDVFERPSHPYTKALLECLPGVGHSMEPIGGTLPDLTAPPEGCRFNPRCPYATDDCRSGDHPELLEAAPDHRAACVYYGPGYDASVIRGESDSEARATDGGHSGSDATGGDAR